MLEQRAQEFRRATRLRDAGLTIAAFLAAHAIRAAFVPNALSDLLPHAVLLVPIVPLWTFLLTFFGAYRAPARTSRLAYVSAISRALAAGLAVLMAILFLSQLHYVSRSIIGMFAVLDWIALVGSRVWDLWRFRRSLRRGEHLRRVLVIGSGNRARRLSEQLIRSSEWGVHIVGHLDLDPTHIGRRVHGSPVLGTIDEIGSILKNQVIDEVILAVPRTMISGVEKIARACEEEGVSFLLMADVFEVNVARMRLVELEGIPLLTFEPVAQEEWELLVKRIIDVVLTALTLPVVLPLMGVIALAVKLDSPGPVLFVQDRVGLHKRRFRMLKFRTMVAGSERLQAQLEHLNEAAGPIFKIRNDPRVTRVGRFLRRTSLDELPQIFHVIGGEMSLVGPRPMSLRDVNLFDRGIQRKRFSVRPGLTCLWQISGRSNLPFSKWLELDLSYIENWSVTLDLKILCKTIPVVLRGTGAV